MLRRGPAGGLTALQHVVFVNWRDSSHPQAGGAELYTESVARRLAARGVRITLVTSRSAGTATEEVVEGVTVVRRGGTFGVYFHALRWLLRHRRSIDAVVDCQNGIPFFAPLALRRDTPIVCLIFHVHQDQFDTYFRWPMNVVGRWLEGPASRRLYGLRTIAVISPSTRADVRRRLKLRGLLQVVPCGMDAPLIPAGAAVRAPEPRIASVGRLADHKRLELLIGALPTILERYPGLRVDLAGTGPAEATLQAQVRQLGLDEIVQFHGRVSDRDRDALLASAWLTVNPSAGEGWGLSVVEANACGLPAVAFRVSGLQDAVVDGYTGWLVPENESLAAPIVAALRELEDPATAARWSERARAWAARFTWDETTDQLLAVVEQEQQRLLRMKQQPEQRSASDLACRVDMPGSPAVLGELPRLCRSTDVWTVVDDKIIALLHATDEAGAWAALGRLGIDSNAVVRTARQSDWLLGRSMSK